MNKQHCLACGDMPSFFTLRGPIAKSHIIRDPSDSLRPTTSRETKALCSLLLPRSTHLGKERTLWPRRLMGRAELIKIWIKESLRNAGSR